MAAGTLVSSGTSLNIPSGSGSERLRRVTVHGLNNGWQNNVISGTAGHIYTILSIVFCEVNNSASTINLKINDGANDIYLLNSHSVSAKDTFVFSDKFVMEQDDDLDVYNSTADGDWIVSFIDQDWT